MLTSFYLARSLPVAPPPQDQHAAIAQEYGNLPVRFEANDGQSKSDARFIARGVGYGVYLTPTEAALVLSDTTNPMPDAAIHIRLAGSNSDPVMSAGSQLEARTNYLIGNDRTKWRTGVKNYDSVRHASVYPGIDLVYHGNQRQLEYDFTVAPGSDPSRIRLEFQGLDRMDIAANGDRRSISSRPRLPCSLPPAAAPARPIRGRSRSFSRFSFSSAFPICCRFARDVRHTARRIGSICTGP